MLAMGRELGDAREAARRSLADVARDAGMSTAYLHKLEHGQVNSPSPKVLYRLSHTLQVPYARLMDLAGYVPPDLIPARPTAPDGDPLFAELTEAEWRAVRAFVEYLVSTRAHPNP
ncbi:helix-turn-helix domain-containing protein [Geodermatophilus sp. DSM 44513]|uniref:helix-turn-helix domain-containing protein n=1 Tax=Geodermatophilus sp. DSM 44513 TaxID=1528104 RepID=UPI001281A39D|nr:helix-turn-helix transcriptional regulator [Geodermatophilus sp. DSM 44513]WNV75168.1 helix-turn-helix transcriptional regulator [Geodermatophilus sp. DSM 44513]